MEDELINSIEVNPGEQSIIKVMGVGGGGCNAVNYLYREGVQDVSFLVCNTDRQALVKSPIVNKLQLGAGLGAGGRPEKAEEFANESREQIREALDDGTEMLFITAGMGGGTGTGASPVVAEVAQELGILTVAIVTIPFAFEGKKQQRKALTGVAKLAKHVDAILVINNENLRIIYPDFDLPNAFDKSDQVVSNAAKAIAEIITVPGYINTDFQDVFNTLKDGGMAIMNVGKSSDEENRITKAIEEALNSPLVNMNDVRGASRILLTFYCSQENAIRMKELDQINEFIDKVGDEVEVKWGASYDDSLGDEVRVTVIATGYNVSNIPGLTECETASQVTAAEPKPTEHPTVDEALANFYGQKPAQEQPTEVAVAPAEEPTTIAPTTESTIESLEEEAIDDISIASNPEESATEEPASTEEPAAESIQPREPDFTFTFDLDDDYEDEMDNTPAWARRK